MRSWVIESMLSASLHRDIQGSRPRHPEASCVPKTTTSTSLRGCLCSSTRSLRPISQLHGSPCRSYTFLLTHDASRRVESPWMLRAARRRTGFAAWQRCRDSPQASAPHCVCICQAAEKNLTPEKLKALRCPAGHKAVNFYCVGLEQHQFVEARWVKGVKSTLHMWARTRWGRVCLGTGVFGDGRVGHGCVWGRVCRGRMCRARMTSHLQVLTPHSLTPTSQV